MNIKSLEKMYAEKPSVLRSTYLVFVFWVLGWILMLAFLGLAIGLLLESAFEYRYFIDWILKSFKLNFPFSDDERWKFATTFGLISLFLSIFFLGTVILCKMILHRNKFILELEDWLKINAKAKL